MIVHEVLYYLGLILILGGFITNIVFLYQIKKHEEKYDSFVSIIKKNLVKVIPSSCAFAVGIILITVAFYIDPYTVDYLKETGISVLWYDQLFVYLFGPLFALALMTFINSLFIKLYIEKFEFPKKLITLTVGISLALTIVFFFIYGEGNAKYLEYPLANAIYIGSKGLKFVNIYVHGNGSHGTGLYGDGLAIYFYAIFILFGACLVLYVCDYKLYKLYGKHDLITNTFLVGFPAGLIGARIWFVVLSVSSGSNAFTGENWVNIFDVRDGGLGIMGGAILGIIAGVSQVLIVKYAMKKPDYKHFSLLTAVDIIVPCILFAQATGRLGNFFNNEVYGGLVDMSYWEFLPTWVKNNMYYQHGFAIPRDGLSGLDAVNFYKESGQFYLPLFAVEFFTNLAGYFILEYAVRRVLRKYHPDGSLLGGYLVWYGITRAILEPMRTNADYYGASEITSYVMIGGGILIIVLAILNKYIVKRKGIWWYKNQTENKEEVVKTEE